MRKFLLSMVVVMLTAGLLRADVEGVVVSYDAAKMVVVIKVGEKERKIEFKKGHPHVHAADGKLLKGKEIEDALKKGVKVDLEEDGNEVEEIKIKKS